MNALRSFLHPMVLAAVVAGAGVAMAAADPSPGRGTDTVGARTTLAITYPEGSSTTVDLQAPDGGRRSLGHADVKRKDGRTRVRVHMDDLRDPRSMGSGYTTYVLWAIAPEGQAESLAELPHSKSFDLDVTTSFQTFGLVVTAEPHSAVRRPGPLVLAENAARPDTKGALQISRIEYDGDIPHAGSPATAARDSKTPLLVLGARNAVESAREAGAERYAQGELREAEVKLAALEQTRPRGRKLPRQLEGMARDVMRLAEHARTVAVERGEEARLASERRAASLREDRARDEAERARRDAERARERAEAEGKQAAAALGEARDARELSAEARREAERARTAEDAARADADNARREAAEAREAGEAAQRQLQESLSAILATRREARGLVVSLSDVLFDFDRATLTPGAREKLSKLAGVMLAYPGTYRIATEGHTDSMGTADYNLRLSEERARSVLSYLQQAGIPAARVVDAVGFGESRPVASNDSAAGRQMNRRVEIVIGGLD